MPDVICIHTCRYFSRREKIKTWLISSFSAENCTHKVNGIYVRVCEKKCSFLLLREQSTQV